MLELYLGLVPGEAAIDRLIDDAVADPAIALPSVDKTDLIVSDPLTGAIVGVVPPDHWPDHQSAAPQRDIDPGDGTGLWRRLRIQWSRALGPVGVSHV
jgi:hypothetical protein